jgi:hemerythrin-like domain-containing protein
MGGIKGNRLTPLKDEHKAIMRQLEVVRGNIEEASPSSVRALRASLHELGARLETHFDRERETLYEPLRSALGKDSPIGSMLEGHKAMKRTYRELLSDLGNFETHPFSPQIRVDLRARVESFQRMFRDYVRKEEKIVFWIAELNLLA